MTMLFLAPELSSDAWVKHLRAQGPDIEVRVWPEVGEAADIELVLSWKHPPGALKRFPRLKAVASLGFGVDHILRDPELPPGVPVLRIVDPAMIAAMSEYVIAAVLMHTRNFHQFRADQAARRWKPLAPRPAAAVRVGIMGLGHLGSDAARKLAGLGFSVAGWSRRPKRIEGVASFAGEESLGPFLERTDILVCLLPLTPATRGILNRRAFERLPAEAYVINAARGEHLVEEDLLAALDNGRLAGACLDVFREEPLPPAHPFWDHPRITVTPHVASLTFPRAVAPQLVENYRRLRAGLAPLNAVDPAAGY